MIENEPNFLWDRFDGTKVSLYSSAFNQQVHFYFASLSHTASLSKLIMHIMHMKHLIQHEFKANECGSDDIFGV